MNYWKDFAKWSMKIDEFISKWSVDKPKIEFFKTHLGDVMFIIPRIAKWESKEQKQRFYHDCKLANIKPLTGKKLKWIYVDNQHIGNGI